MATFSQSLLSWFPLLPLFLLPLLFLIMIMKPRRQLRLNLPPTPPTLPFIGNLHQLGKIPHFSLFKLSQKHGPAMLLKLGQVPTLIVSSPETAKDVMKTHDLDCCSRPVSLGNKTLSYNHLDIAFGPYTEYWRHIRKLCVVELFTVKRVQYFSHVRDTELSKMLDDISSLCGTGRAVNVTEKVFELTNAIICKVAFGNSYEGKQFESGKLQEAIDETMAMSSSFWFSDFFPTFGWILDVWVGLHKRLDQCFRRLDGFFERVIEQHLQPDRQKPDHDDLVDILIRLSKDQTGPVRLSRDHIKSLLMDIFIGGIDTSSLTLGWAMSELAKSPRAMKKLQAEIRSVVGKKPKVLESDLDNLPYLKMVVKETFRLHPPATLLLPRETMRDCKIGGYDVPAKTRILVNVWAIGRDPKIWENPEVFYPERFENSEVDFKGQHFELLPFGAGRRICPGLTMGTTAVESTLANLLHCFDWELPSGMNIEDISMEEEAGLTVHKKYPLHLVPVKYKWEEYEDYLN